MTQRLYRRLLQLTAATIGPLRGWSLRLYHADSCWTDNLSRLMAVSLIPLTIAPFAAGSLNPIMDAALAGAILLHSHIGFQYVTKSTEIVNRDLLRPDTDLSSLTTYPRKGCLRRELFFGGVCVQPR